jgi:hypothetical protein
LCAFPKVEDRVALVRAPTDEKQHIGEPNEAPAESTAVTDNR